MRIRAWNAYASNNSGSYVIVGSFPTDDAAADLAAELRDACERHGQWITALWQRRPEPDASPEPDDSDGARRVVREPESDDNGPLYAFARAQGVHAHAAPDIDDWPEYSDKDHPDVWAVGHQVLVYCGYCVSLPQVLGAIVYARGGSVTSLEDHAHDVLVAVIDFSWPWNSRDQHPPRPGKLLRALRAADGPLARYARATIPPTWRIEHDTLRLAAAFDDLVAATSALRDVAAAFHARTSLRIHEALDPRNPTGFLAPSHPPDRAGLVRLRITDLGPDRDAVHDILREHGIQHGAPAMPSAPIEVFAKGAHRLRGEWEAARLRQAGATLDVVEHAPPPRGGSAR